MKLGSLKGPGPLLSSIFVAFLAALGPSHAHAKNIHVTESTTYYEISGRSASALRDEMHEKGPDSLTSLGEALAATETNFSWYADFNKSAYGCEIESVDIALDVHFIMPKWVEYDRGNRRLKKTWDAFLESLWIHERGHGEIARRGASLLSEQFVALPPQGTCEQLEDVMQAMYKKVVKEAIQPAQRRYDRLTNEGQEQGAKF